MFNIFKEIKSKLNKKDMKYVDNETGNDIFKLSSQEEISQEEIKEVVQDKNEQYIKDEVSENITSNSTPQISEEIIENAKNKLISYKAISISKLSEELEISIEQAELIIQILIAEGVIESEGLYEKNILETIEKINNTDEELQLPNEEDDTDSLLMEAIEICIETGQASTSFIQRRLKVGYARAGRIIDQMEERGIVSGYEGSKPREVLMTKERWQELNTIMDAPIDIHNDAQKNIDIYKLYKLDENYLQEYKKTNIELIKNIFVERMDESTFEKLIDTFVIHSNPEELKAMIINGGFLKVSHKYNRKWQLIIPVVEDIKKSVGAIAWLNEEMQKRYGLFSSRGIKTLEEYNQKMQDIKLPQILLIIDDYSILKNHSEALANLNNYIQEILIRGERVGIYIVIGSKLDFEDTGINKISAYCKVIKDRELNKIISIQEKGENGDRVYKNNIEEIDNCSGLEFEKYVQQILLNNNFVDVEVTKSSGDQGADVIAYKDGIKYAIQCKKFSQPVGNSAVQEVIGSKSIYNCHVAVVITNNYFTKSAKELAEKNQVLLWDRNELIKLLSN